MRASGASIAPIPWPRGERIACVRLSVVADEMEVLLAQGVDYLHLCDSEFNLPYEHAVAVCEEITRRGLGERVSWYAYLEPGALYRRAGPPDGKGGVQGDKLRG